MPEHIAPMLARPGSLPPEDGRWAFELKWDGVRAITYWRRGRMRIESRNLNDVSARYPELCALAEQLGAREAVLDGEIVAFDEHGVPSFERLQTRMHLSSQSAVQRAWRQTPVTYMIFDVLHLEGQVTMGLSYDERRALLAELRLTGPVWQTPACHYGSGADFLAATAAHGLEGVIAKRRDFRYLPGQRSGAWLKVKNTTRQELVIGGWLAGQGGRSGQLGALLMGYYEQHAGRRELRYAGRVGTGFDERELARLATELAARGRRSSPFAKRGAQPPPHARFAAPELVAEIEFSSWTRQGILRHSSYRGLRADKPAREVERERPSGETSSQRESPSGETPLQRESPSGETPSQRERPSGDTPYEVLRETKRFTEVAVGSRTLRLTNREKILFPRASFTKGQLIDYYAAVAPVLLPHLAGRPLTLKRYPDGVQGPHFYEKRAPGHRPDWVRTAAVWSGRQEEEIDYCLADDLPTLIWLANLADIELHPSLALASDIDTPTALVFDLDPGEPAGLRECCCVALSIKELFDTFALQTLAKSSGGKGLQVYVPLNTPVSYGQTKPFARAVAELLAQRHPKLVVSRMSTRLRAGKVLIDWSQNDPHKTTVCVYSLRAAEQPVVSTPLAWEEVQRAARRRSEPQLSLSPQDLLARVAREGDLFAALVDLRQELPDLARPR
jgi:bifunctional non-homologous end joining protein LigD